MNDNRGPEGSRMNLPGWNPTEDNEARPYLDQVADLRAQLAENEAQRNSGANAEEQRAERERLFAGLAIKLDAAARRTPPSVVDDIDIRFNTLEEHLRNAGRLRLEMGPGKQPIYKTLERIADGKSKLTMGELEAARGHFLRWHSSDAQQQMAANTTAEPPVASGLTGIALGMFRSASSSSRAQHEASAHLRAYFGRDFGKHGGQYHRSALGASKLLGLGAIAILIGIVFLQGMESASDPYDDSLGFFGRIIYNMGKLPASVPADKDTPLIGDYAGASYINKIMLSDSRDVTTTALKAHFSDVQAKLASSNTNLLSRRVEETHMQAITSSGPIPTLNFGRTPNNPPPQAAAPIVIKRYTIWNRLKGLDSTRPGSLLEVSSIFYSITGVDVSEGIEDGSSITLSSQDIESFLKRTTEHLRSIGLAEEKASTLAKMIIEDDSRITQTTESSIAFQIEDLRITTAALHRRLTSIAYDDEQMFNNVGKILRDVCGIDIFNNPKDITVKTLSRSTLAAARDRIGEVLKERGEYDDKELVFSILFRQSPDALR